MIVIFMCIDPNLFNDFFGVHVLSYSPKHTGPRRTLFVGGNNSAAHAFPNVLQNWHFWIKLLEFIIGVPIIGVM